MSELSTRPGANDQSTKISSKGYATDLVISRDGTTIGYRQLGQGPGLVVVHGGMESSQSHMQLADALGDTFTVYLPDRRGRGLSGPYNKYYSAQSDIDDIQALLAKTGARNIFGVSSGALISLQAALSLPNVRKAAVYEPPLLVDGSESTVWIARYDKEMAEGRVATALVTAMKGSHMGPPIFNLMPRRLLELLTNKMMASEDKKARPDDVTMRKLAPTLHYDFQLVKELRNSLESFRDIRAEVLLLGGSKSPAYLKAAVNSLEGVLPNVTRVEFPGLGHGGSGNANRGGRPKLVAQELRRFFA